MEETWTVRCNGVPEDRKVGGEVVSYLVEFSYGSMASAHMIRTQIFDELGDAARFVANLPHISLCDDARFRYIVRLSGLLPGEQATFDRLRSAVEVKNGE